MSLQRFAAAMLRNWWVILGLAILAAVGSAWGVSQQSAEYRASAMVELRPSAELDRVEQTISIYNLIDKRTPINTIARKATSTGMQTQIAAKLQGQGISLAEIKAADITADVLPQANLIEISAKSENPEHAAAICNMLASTMLDQAGGRVMEMELIDPATAPSAPIGPQQTRIIVLGLLSGLVFGVVIALLEDVLRASRLTRAKAGMMS